MQNETVIPLIVEESFLEKRQKITSRVRVSTVTRRCEQLLSEALVCQSVQVERVLIGKFVDEIPTVRQEGDTLIVPVVDEVLITRRRLLLKEEVRVRLIRRLERYQRSAIVRRQEAVIESHKKDKEV